MSLKYTVFCTVLILFSITISNECAQAATPKRARRVPSLEDAKAFGDRLKEELYEKMAQDTLKQIKRADTLELLRLKDVKILGQSHEQGARLQCKLFYVRSIDKRGCLSKRGHALNVHHQLTPAEFVVYNSKQYEDYFFKNWKIVSIMDDKPVEIPQMQMVRA